MRIYVPNSAFLGNIEAFVSRLETSPGNVDITVNPRWVSVHPMVIAMLGAAGLAARREGGSVTIGDSPAASLRYLVRMGLYDRLGVAAPAQVVEHEAAGRFIPLTQVTNSEELQSFIVDMIPLLHAPDESGPIKYVVSELVRNVFEHSRSPVGAFVCAQYFAKSRRLSIGVADVGRGIRASLAEHHATVSDLDAIQLAMQPGISGTSPNFGGNEYNAGAGLFFTKSIARASRNFFVVYSGTGLFKLLKGPVASTRDLNPDPRLDRATRHSDLPRWPGTAIGIDFGVESHSTFKQLLKDIYTTYRLEVRSAKKDKFKRARFV